MDTDDYAGHLESEGRALLVSARMAGPNAPVPTCPGWTVTELLRHVSYIHRWAARYLAEELTEMQAPVTEVDIVTAGPTGEDLFSYYEEGLGNLVTTIRDSSPDLTCWTIMSNGRPREEWARRQAHETTVHRADAELSAHVAISPVSTEFAMDGIDELLGGFFARDTAGEVLGVIGLRPTDSTDTWAIDLTDTRAHGRRSPASATMWIDSPASELYFALWHRADFPTNVHDDNALLALWNVRGVRW